ncbi:MAG: hypothetical protein R6W78_09740 [Bacteroidales bacterium]
MIKLILKLRILQLVRFLNSIGILRLIVLIIICVYTLMLLLNSIRQSDQISLVPFVFGAALLAIHFSRRDRQFLKMVSGKTYFLFLSEYLVISMPLFILGAIYRQWFSISGLLAVCLVVPLFKARTDLSVLFKWFIAFINPAVVKNSFRFTFRIPFVKPVDFEWISGIRKNLVILLTLYLLLIIFSFKPYVAPVGLICLSFMISGFYLYGESKELIEEYAQGPKRFIIQKVVCDLKLMLILFSPLIIISLIFNFEHWYFLAWGIFVSVSIQVFSVVFKYGIFKENADLSRNMLLVVLNALFILIPFFWPAPVIMVIRYYRKAIDNLKYYFNAEN